MHVGTEQIWEAFSSCVASLDSLRGGAGSECENLDHDAESSATPSPGSACEHSTVARMQGSLVCTTCGLVIEDRILDEESWREGYVAPPLASRDRAWRTSTKRVLLRLGYADAGEMARVFKRPAGLSAIGQRLEVLAAYGVYLQFSGFLSEEHARKAADATSQEWSRAATLLKSLRAFDFSLTEEESFVYREARQKGLPDVVAEAVVRALDTPRLECCDPKKILVACTAESLGEEISASLFRVSRAEVKLWRSRYYVAQFCPNLYDPGRALEQRVEACGKGLEHETVAQHLRACSSCAFYAERTGMAFMLRL